MWLSSSQKPEARNQNVASRTARLPFPWFLASGFWLLVSGCGFQPIYATSNPGVIVEILDGDRRLGQQLQADLEDALNPSGRVPANAPYRLVVTLANSEGAIGVARDGTVSRYNVYLDSNYKLFKQGTEKPVATGSLRQVSSYNNLTNQYFSTYLSQQDALKRGITELAALYRQRLATELSE